MSKTADHMLEGAINYTFHNKSLLDQALTTKAYSIEHNTHFRDYLATLGDAVLDLYWAEKSIELGYKDKQTITDYRTSWVNRKAQAEMMDEILEFIDPIKLFRMGQREIVQKHYIEESFLELAFEAIIGAVSSDSDYPTAKKIVDYIYLVYP